MPETSGADFRTMPVWLRGHDKVDATDDWLLPETDECPTCKGAPLALTLEHGRLSGADFRGKIVAQCSRCSKEWALKGWGGRPDEAPERVEQPTCRCGHRYFYVMGCSRFDDDDFYDESICWGQCAKCGCFRIIARSD